VNGAAPDLEVDRPHGGEARKLLGEAFGLQNIIAQNPKPPAKADPSSTLIKD
jgi:hypothetical protein